MKTLDDGLAAHRDWYMRAVCRIWLSICMFGSLAHGQANQPAASRPASQGEFDGPAELPRVYVKSALADTPATGKVLLVKAGGDLQEALDSAVCGTVIKLEAGAVFSGHFLLPKKSCDDAHWIIIRTSASDEDLPAEGTRLTPCYAGVASLPGRPDFHCTSTRNVMAKIVSTGKGISGPINFSDGANHYRFIGVEITRESPGISILALAAPDGRVPADHIIFDRVWLHGTAHDETRRGVFLSGTTYMAVVDSFFNDFHCTAKVGSCTDSQAISGALGDLPMGPYKIVNNFLEAAGENLLLGGGQATRTPADIEIRHNYLYKPLAWIPGAPGFMGGDEDKPFIVKNLFELKNAQRVLFEGNVLEGAWGGFSQSGFSILLTPKNQNNVCPQCRVTDITIRYCKIAHVAGGFWIGNSASDAGGISSGGGRYSIHDVVIDDIDGNKYNGHGTFMALISNDPVLKDVKMDHLTALSARVFLNIGIKHEKIQNFTFTSNLVAADEKQITSTGGGVANCAFHADRLGPEGVLKNCVDSLTFTHNAIIGGFGSWPPGNFFPKNVKSVGLENGAGLDEFRLCKAKEAGCNGASKYAAAGTDGKDVGADIERLEAVVKGVT
jgi:hypothetical protein